MNKRLKELLPVPYFHVVFTLPSEISDRLIGIDETVYRELFRTSSQTLLYFFKSKRGGQPGLIGVLHTWGQTMSRHPHIHYLVTGGCLSFDKKRWVPSGSEYLFDVKELSADFRRRFLRGLKGKGVELSDLKVEEKDWVVYCRKPFAGPEKMIEYQGRYVNRTAISNRRIQSITETGVTFDYKDYRDEDEKGIPKHKSMTVDGVTFIRLFLQHVLPSHFRRIRYYGILAGKNRSQKIKCVRKLFHVIDERAPTESEGMGKENQVICPKCGEGKLLPISLLFRIRPPPIVFANERVKEGAA
ncbi:MAG: transposase [Nitrospinota bacterium]|nr:transposase [Nitrospinota bacterium]